MLAFITNVNPMELMLIAFVAILIFGRRLPEVAGQAAGHMQRARRALNDLKRESGLAEELRDMRRVMDEAANPQPKPAAGAKLPKIEPPGHAVGRHEGPPEGSTTQTIEQPPAENDATNDSPADPATPVD